MDEFHLLSLSFAYMSDRCQSMGHNKTEGDLTTHKERVFDERQRIHKRGRKNIN